MKSSVHAIHMRVAALALMLTTVACRSPQGSIPEFDERLASIPFNGAVEVEVTRGPVEGVFVASGEVEWQVRVTGHLYDRGRYASVGAGRVMIEQDLPRGRRVDPGINPDRVRVDGWRRGDADRVEGEIRAGRSTRIMAMAGGSRLRLSGKPARGSECQLEGRCKRSAASR